MAQPSALTQRLIDFFHVQIAYDLDLRILRTDLGEAGTLWISGGAKGTPQLKRANHVLCHGCGLLSLQPKAQMIEASTLQRT